MSARLAWPSLRLALSDDKALWRGSGPRFLTRLRRIRWKPGDYPMPMDVNIQKPSIYLAQNLSTLQVLILHPQAGPRKRVSHLMTTLNMWSETGSTGRYKSSLSVTASFSELVWIEGGLDDWKLNETTNYTSDYLLKKYTPPWMSSGQASGNSSW